MSWRPTGSPSAKPQGTEIPGLPARFAGTVNTSARYISSGSSVFSPKRKAGDGVVGVPWAFLEKGVDPRVMAAFRDSLQTLAAEGATLVDVALPHAGHAIATYYIVATAEASSNLARFDGARSP